MKAPDSSIGPLNCGYNLDSRVTLSFSKFQRVIPDGETRLHGMLNFGMLKVWLIVFVTALIIRV